MSSRDFQDKLRRRARRSGVSVDPAVAEQLEKYFRLLSQWNSKINLTGLDLAEGAPAALDRLLIEPLIAVRHVASTASRMLDIGSGGGSPAIPLALAARLQVVMVESKTRKSVFLREVVRALEIPSAEVVNARYEELLARPDLHETQDLVTIRAVRLETRTLMTLQAFVRPGGHVFLFRSSAMHEPSHIFTPPLAWVATYPLLESGGSRLVVLQKRPVGRTVPRGTQSA